MQLMTAAGVALAWGLLGGVIDATLVSEVRFSSTSVALRYLAPCALLVAALSLPFGLAAWGTARWLARGGVEARRQAIPLLACQAAAILAPCILVVLRELLKSLPNWISVVSPQGFAILAGVLLGSVASVAALTWLAVRVVGTRFGFGKLALAGGLGAAVALVMTPAVGSGGGATAAGKRPNVLLISVDSLRRDVFDEYLAYHASPTLKRFVTEGRRYENAHTTFTHSLPSHASMFTGRYPPAHGALVFKNEAGSLGSPISDGVTTLAVAFAAAGYQTVAILQNGWIGPPYGLEAGFATYVNYGLAGSIGYYDPQFALAVSLISPYVRYLDARLVRTVHPSARTFLRWLRGRDRSRPFFAFLHFIEMHTPNDPPASVRERFVSGPLAHLGGTEVLIKMEDGEFTVDEIAEVPSHLRNLHMASFAQMDDILSPVLEELMEAGWLDDTLVALVSDHGENLYEKAGTYGKSHVYHTSSEVPFVLRVPGESLGVESSRPVSLVDIASTFYAYTGVDPPPGLQGVDLLAEPPPDGQSDAWIYVQGWDSDHRDWAEGVLFADGHKWIRNGAGEGELYDLRSDPQEELNLSRFRRGEAASYRRRFDDARESLGGAEREPLSIDELPDRVADQLKALGYVK